MTCEQAPEAPSVRAGRFTFRILVTGGRDYADTARVVFTQTKAMPR